MQSGVARNLARNARFRSTGLTDKIGGDGRGLRPCKKRATRALLRGSALRFAVERSLDNVWVEDIADAAGVASHTCNHCFSSREEAICALGVERAQRLGAALRARPPGEHLCEAIMHALVEPYAGDGEPDKVGFRLIMSSPALQGEDLKTAVIEQPVAEAIAARSGRDMERDLFLQVLATAVSCTVRVAME